MAKNINLIGLIVMIDWENLRRVQGRSDECGCDYFVGDLNNNIWEKTRVGRKEIRLKEIRIKKNTVDLCVAVVRILFYSFIYEERWQKWMQNLQDMFVKGCLRFAIFCLKQVITEKKIWKMCYGIMSVMGSTISLKLVDSSKWGENL